MTVRKIGPDSKRNQQHVQVQDPILLYADQYWRGRVQSELSDCKYMYKSGLMPPMLTLTTGRHMCLGGTIEPIRPKVPNHDVPF